MTETITIPRLTNEDSIWDDYPVVGQPGWYAVTSKDKPAKPLIRCNCGHITGIGLHHVHSDGRITASFYHKKGNIPPEDPNGCEWHVYLVLADWTGEDFPPESR